MSRIGKKPVPVPDGVNVTVNGATVEVKGPKGALRLEVPQSVRVQVENGQVLAQAADAAAGALQGLMRSLIANMVTGVSQGYSKELEIQGVGFKASVDGDKVTFLLGYSSPVVMSIPEGIEVKVADNVRITVSGADKQMVGDVAARIKSFYPAEPYKGKGIRFKGENIRRKAGKTVA